MRKESNKASKDKGFKERLAKAVGYIGIGCMIGFILGFLASSEITHRTVVEAEYTQEDLSEEYTVVLMQTERLLPNGDIEVLSSKVLEVRR